MPKKIFLIGPMGAGKSTVGRRLAEALGYDFHDSDDEIETRTGVDIPLIFEKEGEAGFRKRESEVIAEMTDLDRVVLATGGGAVLAGDNRLNLASRGYVIYLQTSVEQTLARTQRDRKRPLLQTDEREKVVKKLLEERHPLYQEIADFIIDTDGSTSADIAKRIVEHLAEVV